TSTFDVTARQWRRAGAYTMFAGAPLVVTGVTLLVLGQHHHADASDYDPLLTGHSLEQKRQMYDEASRLQRWGIVTSGVGAAAMLTGAIIFSAGRTPAARTNTEGLDSGLDGAQPDLDAPKVSWQPYLSPLGVGINLTW